MKIATVAIIAIAVYLSAYAPFAQGKDCPFAGPCDHAHVEAGPVRLSAVANTITLLKEYSEKVIEEKQAQGTVAIEKAFFVSLILFREIACAYDKLNENERGAFFFMASNYLPDEIHSKTPGASIGMHPKSVPNRDWRRRFEYFLDHSFEEIEYGELALTISPEEQEEILEKYYGSLKRHGLTVCHSQ